MKKQIGILIVFVVLIAINNPIRAVIAYPYPIEITQPDGSKITIILRGDENVKWAETVDGYSILRNNQGIYEYAIINSNNDLVPSGVRVRDLPQRSSSDNQFLNNIKKGLSYSQSQIRLMRSISKMNENFPEKVFPTTGSRKLVCILIGFTDVAFTKTKADFENLFNQAGYITDGATGSVYDFYKGNSYNQLDLTVTVAGPYTASNTMAYYGANDVSGNDIRPRELVTEAVNLADPDVNYADFDNDGDGTVDGVYVIYAGYGEEAGASPDAIWAHAWSITPVSLDGKTISRYSCSSELRGTSGTGLTRIGVICHEFGHVMGAMDFYDTDYATGGSYSGTGYWDVMASGSWNNSGTTPAYHNPYTKVYYYGWATATTLTTPTNITLNNAEQNSNSFYRVNTATTNEYFLIENRQQHLFDTYISGHGMIIYHVDGNYISTAGNKINAGSHQGMYPVCADATGNPPTTYGTINSSGLPFPGTGSKTSFTDATTPWAKSWAGANTNLPITNITENTTNKTINFDFPGIDTTDPSNFSAISGGATQINLGWTKNSGNNNVMIASSTSSTLGTPANGTVYVVGNSIPGGGTVIYSGSATSYNQTGLTGGTKYYYKAWSIKAGNSYSTGITTEGMTSYSLPYSESFGTSALPAGWTTQNTGTSITERWTLSNSTNAGGAAYELKCSWQNVNPGTTRVITPAIYTTGVSGLSLSFKHYYSDFAAGATIRIQSSTDKVTWTNEAWSAISGGGSLGPATVSTTVASNLNSATTYVAFVVEGNLYNINYWYIDDVSIITSAVVVPTLTTTSVTSITQTTAVSGGNITSDGGGAVIARGVCWATTSNPTIANSKTSDGTGTGIFVSILTGLSPGTTYHVRAYATNSAGTAYGSDLGFISSPVVVATLTTTTVTSIAQKTAVSGGNITGDGGGTIIARGVCWATTANPTIADDKTTDGTGTGSFVSNLAGLLPGTTYHVRAYATNNAGTAYGNDIAFTTNPITVATLTTAAVKTITKTTATSGGDITSDGGAPVTMRGVCWATTANPTIANFKTTDGTGTGTFGSDLTGLVAGTIYNVRAYATNSAGTAYGNEISFKTYNSDAIIDIDGNYYNIVTIGSQILMAENLKTTTYNDGTPIPLVTDNNEWSALSTPGYCWYNNDAVTNKATYGALYIWYAVSVTTNGGKNVCPTGWHVPSDAEWYQLALYLDPNATINDPDVSSAESFINGGKLKESGTSHWQTPNTGATNEVGFTALPGGVRETNGYFLEIGYFGYWWSSTLYDAGSALYRDMFYANSRVDRSQGGKGIGYSVRCVKDNNPSGTHFTPVWWPGSGMDHMNLYALTATLDGTALQPGDEIGIFDGTICVGMGVLTQVLNGTIYLSMVASRDDPDTPLKDGYTTGNIITYRLWDLSAGSEVSNVVASYTSGEGIYAVGATSVFHLTGFTAITQNLSLTAGWNIMSFAAQPTNMSMLSIVNPLITAATLTKVQDERGNAIEQLPAPIGWVDNIGLMKIEEGYKIKVTGNTTLSVTGLPVTLPYTITLSTGWNIMGYPSMSSRGALAAFNPLITAATLLKVQDEAGNAIEQLPAPIGWIDNIINLTSGHGYKVKTTINTSLVIDNTSKGEYQKSEAAIITRPTHFKLAYTGNGLDQMNIYIKKPTVGGVGIKTGDEIGVFDGGLCVGAFVVNDPTLEYYMVVASLDDPGTKAADGFTEGNNFELRLWDNQAGLERKAQQMEIDKGYNKTFEKLGTSVLAVDFETVTYTSLGDAFPNPSTDKTTFTFQLGKESKVRLEIFNMEGDLIKVLVDRNMAGGTYQIEWNNRTNEGIRASSGVYFYRLKLNNFTQTRQLVIH